MYLVRRGLIDDAHDSVDLGPGAALNLKKSLLELARNQFLDEEVPFAILRQRLEDASKLEPQHMPALVRLLTVAPDRFLNGEDHRVNQLQEGYVTQIQGAVGLNM